MHDLLYLHNMERAKVGLFGPLPPLLPDEELMEYAQHWAERMGIMQQMKHSDMKDILALGFNLAGENVAYGARTEEAVMSMWMKSRGHRKNIMSSKFNYMGWGQSKYKSKHYWCVCFGRK